MDFALEDPKGFINRYRDGVIIDEVQNAPLLFSYLQETVDKKKKMGQFILTGSRQFGLLSKITQSLAGRVGLLELLPLAESEINSKFKKIDNQLFTGHYPALYNRKISPLIWYEDYIQTYIQRDVRQLVNVKNLSKFRVFLKLCAARNGRILNISELCQVSDLNRETVNSWLSVLEASYIIHFVPPYYKNFSKRLIKSSKIYFYDTGIASHLLGLRSPEEVFLSPSRGFLFESMIVSEMKKHNMNYRKGQEFYFWKDNKGVEVDVLFETNQRLYSVEIKSGKTIQKNHFNNLKIYQEHVSSLHKKSFFIHTGDNLEERKHGMVLPWKEMKELFGFF